MSHFLNWSAPDTLRKKLLRWVLLPMAVLLVLNVVLIHQLGHASADRRHDRFLSDTSKILLDQLRTNHGEVEFIVHSGALNLLQEDSKDQVFYSLSGWQEEYQFGYADLPAPPLSADDAPVFYETNYMGRQMRLMAAIVPETDVASGRVRVVIGKTLVLHDERAVEWMWRVLPLQLLLVLLTGITLWWGVGRGLRPLTQLRNEVKRRSSMDLSPLPEDQVVAEVRPLIHGFNELLARLDTAFVMKRRFIADAAHQLRTPLTGLKAQAELALRLDDAAEIRHSLEQICKAADHASRLANQLLLLARAEPGAHLPSNELDLRQLAKSVTESWVLKALEKQIDLGFEADDHDARLLGNAILLGEMLNNLLDNALRYTQCGGRVTVRLRATREALCLEVEDNGPGIPLEERERVFERFHRVLGTNQDGCGLGLAIVREIASQHHATITLLSGAEGEGTTMRVVFSRIALPDAVQQLGY